MLDLIQLMQNWLLELMGDYSQKVLVTNLILLLFTIIFYWGIYILVFRGFRALSRRVLKEDSPVQPLKIQKQEILSAKEMAMIINRSVIALSWVLRVLIILSVINKGVKKRYALP